jgi:hypothetical protein
MTHATTFTSTNTNRRGGRASLGRDSRGVSVVLGAILMFALVLMLLVLFQTTLVPSLNEATEFEHNERAQNDMEAFQADLLSASATGAPGELTLETGLRYPERAFLLNPPPVAGDIETTPGTVSMVGFVGTDVETIDYWNGTTPRQYDTRTLSYRVDYNEYRNAPTTVYEHATLYNVFDGGTVLPTGNGKLISGNRITLVVVEGDLSTASTRSVTTTIDPVSAPAKPTLLRTGAGGGYITVTTAQPAATWKDEILAGEPHVLDVTDAGANAVTIELEGSVTYEVRMAKIGVGSGYDGHRNPTYIRVIEGDGAELASGETQRIGFEVLDEYNNPVPGVTVNATTSAGSEGLTTTQERTDVDGQVVFEYQPGSEGPVDVVGSFFDGSSATEVATATLSVTDGANGAHLGGAGALDLNPARVDYDVIMDNTTRTKESVVIEFNNTISADQTIDRVRINYYFGGQPTGVDQSTTFSLDHEGTTVLTDHPIGYDFATLNPKVTIAEETVESLTVTFDNLGNSAHDGFFVMSVVFTDESTGVETTRVYIVPGIQTTGPKK